METLHSTQRIRFASHFKVFIFFLSFFLILLILYYQFLLSSTQKQIESEKKGALSKWMEEVKNDLSGHLIEAQEDPYYLYALGSKTRLRITLFNRAGVVIRDSNGKLKTGELLDASGFPSGLPGSLWTGESVYLSFVENQKEIRELFDRLQANNPAPLGVRILQESEALNNPEGETFLFFLKLFGAVGLVSLGITLYRLAKELFKKERFLERGALQDSNPVLYTFQGLIQELKIKEQELEKLKNQAENRAARSENFQEAILRSVNSGVITFNKEKIITSFNAAAEKIFGIPRQKALGKGCSDVFGPESKILFLLNKTILDYEPIARAEFEVLRGKAQEKIWIGVSSSFLKDQQENFLGTTFIFTDLTEIKVLQEQVELQKRLTVLGEMSAGIAHEFRNFMGTIFGYVRLLGKKVDKEHPDQKMIEAIISELKAMDHLIHELLSFGKKTPVNKTRILLNPFFFKLISQMDSRYKPESVQIQSDISDPALAVFADEILIRQAFFNLIKNAMEAMPAGGICSIHAEVNPMEKNSMVLIQIKDTGTGIAKEHLEKIFVPFFTQKEKGTGLGLAIVHKIILSNGGRIKVESEEGRGTVFKIYLPAGG